MEHLRQQVARAQRRLVTEQFLGRLVWCVLAGLIVAVVAIAVPKVFVIEGLPASWGALWLAGGVVAGFLAAGVWTLVSRRTPLEAAIEIDQRFALRERVASSLSLSKTDQASPAGQALLKDAMRAVDRIDVGDRFRVRLDRRAWWPLVPAMIAFCLMTFVGNRQATSRDDPSQTTAAQKKQIKESAEALRKKIAERRKAAEKQGLKDAEGLFKEIEKASQELTEKQDVNRTQAVVKLNDLAKELEQRKQQLGGKDELQKQFNALKNLGKGPGDKLADAMKQGDWKKALEAVEKLQKDLAEGTLSEEQKQDFIKQLEQMKDKLGSIAEARKQAMEDLQKQIEEQRRQGNLQKAGELQQKLDQLAQQQQMMNQMQQMAQQMAQAQQALQQGNQQQAAEAMQQMAQQLGQMQQQIAEMEMLDAALDQLEMARAEMAGMEMPGMQGEDGMGEFGMGFGENFAEMGGQGMGRGQGRGPRPDEENDTSMRDTRVRQKPGRGAAVFDGMVDGPNRKGEAIEAIKEEMTSLGTEPADPLTNERLPRSRREHAEEYFRLLREGA